MPNEIFVDGIRCVNASGLDQLQFTYSLNTSNQTFLYDLGSQITFTSKCAERLHEKFFSDCEGCNQTCDVQIYVDCCKRNFDFIFNYEGVKSCPDVCTFFGNPITSTAATQAYNCLNGSLFWDNGFIDAYQHPRFVYCQLVDEGGIFSRPDFELRYHPTPLIREILEYNAKRCGLELCSNFFTSTIYKNAMLLFAEVQEGLPLSSNDNWIPANNLPWTTIDLLEKIKPLFNIDYRISDGKLTVEKTEYFSTNDITLMDLGLEWQKGNIDSTQPPCFSYVNESNCAYGRFEYSSDEIDEPSNQALPMYNDIIDYNTEGSDSRRGECTTQVEFGVLGQAYTPVGFFIPNCSSYSNSFTEPHFTIGRARLPKIIIWDGQDRNYAQTTVRTCTIENSNGRQEIEIFNYEMFFNKSPKINAFFNLESGSTEPVELTCPGENLQDLHVTTSPEAGCLLQLDPIRWFPDNFCDAVNQIEENDLNQGVETSQGKAFFDGEDASIIVDFQSKSILLNGLKIRCNA